MKIIFCGYMFDDAKTEIKKMKHPGSVSGHIYQTKLLNGLINNSDDVYVVNLSHVQRYPYYPQKKIKEKDFVFNERVVGKSAGFINLRGMHLFSQYMNFKKIIIQHIRENVKENKDEKFFLICFNYYLPIILAMHDCRKKYKNVYLCSAIGDLPGKYGVLSLEKINSLIGRIKVTIADAVSELILKKFNCYVFFTKHMANVLNAEKKSFIISEGIYDIPETKNDNINEDLTEKIIFYAGTLRMSFGIAHLLNAFALIDSPEYRLYIAGDGEGAQLVNKYAENDRRIKYLGFIDPSEVDEMQRKSTVMVNPRIAGNYEYVKYSFPSKTLEALASGKPYIAHRLPCDPPEYENYIQYVRDDSDKALAEKIVEICSLSESERIKIGEKSKKFIQKEKNSDVTARKIINMWENML